MGQVIDFAIDDERRRQGKFTPGARLPIHDASILANGREPILCLLAVNSESEARVKGRLGEITSRPIRFASLCAPSDTLHDLAQIESL